jgi:RNA polymerase sigma-70 factor (ECF subfamily)
MDDRERFELLYQEHAGSVLAFARRRVAPADADDVVAEVFLAAWRRWDELPRDPLAWLLGIARGALANRRRGEARASALHDRLRGDRSAAPSEIGYGSLEVNLAEALGELSAGDQELLLLVAWEGLSRRQIAAVLGVSPGTAAVRLHRARVRLVRALADRRPAQETPLRSEEVI